MKRIHHDHNYNVLCLPCAGQCAQLITMLSCFGHTYATLADRHYFFYFRNVETKRDLSNWLKSVLDRIFLIPGYRNPVWQNINKQHTGDSVDRILVALCSRGEAENKTKTGQLPASRSTPTALSDISIGINGLYRICQTLLLTPDSNPRRVVVLVWLGKGSTPRFTFPSRDVTRG